MQHQAHLDDIDLDATGAEHRAAQDVHRQADDDPLVARQDVRHRSAEIAGLAASEQFAVRDPHGAESRELPGRGDILQRDNDRSRGVHAYLFQANLRRKLNQGKTTPVVPVALKDPEVCDNKVDCSNTSQR